MSKKLVAAAVLCFMLSVFAAPARGNVETGVVFGARSGGASVDAPAKTAELGATWVRLFAQWSVFEPADNRFNEAYVKQFVDTANQLKREGRKVLAVAFTAPAWASGSEDHRVPPRNPADFSAFVAEMIARTGGNIDAWEIWNEPDENIFWADPSPAAYTKLLTGAAPGIRAADPNAIIVTGGTVGNNHDFVRGIYANGGKDSFDAVGVHTDTACLVAPPTFFYREPDGDVGRYTFAGYREVHQVMADNGDGNKPIWMTELGWESTGDRCYIPGREKYDRGVSEAKQAEFLELAYRCMAQDPYMQVGIWFSLQDVSATEHHGLVRDNGTNKPAFGALRTLARGGPVTPGNEACGGRLDSSAPTIRLLAPTEGTQYFNRLLVEATASDDGKITRMEMYADGVRVPGSQSGNKFRLDWIGSRRLSFGRHKITVRAYDEGRNFTEASTTVTRVSPSNLPTVKPTVELRRGKVRAGRRIKVSGRLVAPKSPVAPAGRVLIEFQLRTGGKWKTRHKYTKGIAKPFAVTARLAKAGRWRVRATFNPSSRPFVRAVSKTLTFRA